ncbi:unnamed protein product [Lampetra fluviatilis]
MSVRAVAGSAPTLQQQRPHDGAREESARALLLLLSPRAANAPGRLRAAAPSRFVYRVSGDFSRHANHSPAGGTPAGARESHRLGKRTFSRDEHTCARSQLAGAPRSRRCTLRDEATAHTRSLAAGSAPPRIIINLHNGDSATRWEKAGRAATALGSRRSRGS